MIDFLGRMVGYYKQEPARTFLAYGQLMRPLEFSVPSPMPMLPYTSYEVTARAGAEFPALMSGVFRSADGCLGVFVVNASTSEHHFRAVLDPSRYGMAEDTVVDVFSHTPNGGSRIGLSKASGAVPLQETLPAHHMTMFQLRPVHGQ